MVHLVQFEVVEAIVVVEFGVGAPAVGGLEAGSVGAEEVDDSAVCGRDLEPLEDGLLELLGPVAAVIDALPDVASVRQSEEDLPGLLVLLFHGLVVLGENNRGPAPDQRAHRRLSLLDAQFNLARVSCNYQKEDEGHHVILLRMRI